MNYAVVVKFELKPHNTQEFLERVKLQAQNSLELEAGCHVFQVWTADDKPNQVFLYEIYEDKLAFIDHLKSAHFIDFDKEVTNWILSKEAQLWDKLAV